MCSHIIVLNIVLFYFQWILFLLSNLCGNCFNVNQLISRNIQNFVFHNLLFNYVGITTYFYMHFFQIINFKILKHVFVILLL